MEILFCKNFKMTCYILLICCIIKLRIHYKLLLRGLVTSKYFGMVSINATLISESLLMPHVYTSQICNQLEALSTQFSKKGMCNFKMYHGPTRPSTALKADEAKILRHKACQPISVDFIASIANPKQLSCSHKPI